MKTNETKEFWQIMQEEFGVDLERLPKIIKIEAKNAFKESFGWDKAAVICWRRRFLRGKEINDFVKDFGASYQDVWESGYPIDKLIISIRKNGIKNPVVIGPQGVGGQFRLIAAIEAGVETIPIVESILRERPEDFKGRTAEELHQYYVKKAIEKGKEIPEKVLEEYKKMVARLKEKL
jgi:hypothetical protein